MRAAQASLLLLWLACGGNGAQVVVDAGVPDADAAADSAVQGSAVQWRDHGAWPVGADGLTPEIHVEVPDGVRSLMLRARPPLDGAPESLCFAFDAVDAPDGTSWLTRSAFRASSGERPDDQTGYALGLWPRVDDPPLPRGTWTIRAALLACGAAEHVGPESLPGGELRIESALLPELIGEPLVRIKRVFAPEIDLEQQARWDAAFLAAIAYLDTAGLAVDEVAPLHLTQPVPPLAPIQVGVGQTNADTLAAAIDDHELTEPSSAEVGEGHPALVVVVPCIDRLLPGGGQLRLTGHATRLPGGPRLPGRASFVLVGTATCAPPEEADADALGRIIAHELGHLFGLPHGTPPSVMTPSPETLTSRPGFTDAEAAALLLSPFVMGR